VLKTVSTNVDNGYKNNRGVLLRFKSKEVGNAGIEGFL